MSEKFEILQQSQNIACDITSCVKKPYSKLMYMYHVTIIFNKPFMHLKYGDLKLVGPQQCHTSLIQ